MEKGYLALVLHAHLPYVRHVEREDYLEERWLFEAITECYIPLLQVFDGLVRDHVSYCLTMSLTPTLLTMLDDELLLERYKKHLLKLLELADKEVVRTAKDPSFHLLALYYKEQLGLIYKYAEQYDFHLIPRFRRLQQIGYLELITCTATHGFLPLMMTEEAIRAQIAVGIQTHEAYLGVKPKGIWLPECGYTPGIDRIMKELGLQFFFVENHAIEYLDPQPTNGLYAPVSTPSGVLAFGRDLESSKQVWSANDGYPGDYDYREYYRDIGFDLDEEYIGPFIHPEGIRVNTGFKYYRITGQAKEKEAYNLEWASDKAATHASNFMFKREKQVEHLSSHMNRKPLIIAPYDAELFGHWWYEGPQFINFLCRKLAHDQSTVKLITPTQYMNEYTDRQHVAQLPTSSWGRDGYGDVWLQDNNSWIYRHLHHAEKRMIEMTRKCSDGSTLQRRAIQQATRELLLAQSSDWAFIMDQQTMVDYAIKRTKLHIKRFTQLYEQVLQDQIDEEILNEWELEYPIFPFVQSDLFLQNGVSRIAVTQEESVETKRKTVMLAWEFPPQVIGGLSRAVYDLSRALVLEGEEIHVITSEVEGAQKYEVIEGVHVHRLSTLAPLHKSDFIDWVFLFNLSVLDYMKELGKQEERFHVIHAHDWLVGYAARELKKMLKLPLIATIHATEHGRNQGIKTQLQHKIHDQEWQLTYEADRVIVCSQYMKTEVEGLFKLPSDKIEVIPNGVNLDQVQVTGNKPERKLFALPGEKIIFFVGRMVREKGVHILLEAIPSILKQCPEVKFVLSGKGPMLEELRKQAFDLGIAHKVLFSGFIDDTTRNALLHYAYAAVFPSLYEPFGIVALEAMATKQAVVLTDTGGLSEISLHGVDSLKVYPGDVQSLVDQLVVLLRDKDLAKQLGVEAYLKVANTYQWKQLAKQTQCVIKEVMS